MQLLVLLCSYTIWIYALVNPQMGFSAFILWFIAFIIIYMTWSNRYAFLSLIASGSYYFTDLGHLNPFYSQLFPFVCSVSTIIIFFALFLKILQKTYKNAGSSGYVGGGGSSDAGGLDIGCDGGGCDGGGD